MKVVRQSLDEASVSDAEIFLGTAMMQRLVAEGDAPSLRVTSVTFKDGARNRWHHHSTEQVLVVTHGNGLVATEREERLVTTGDVTLIAAEERHWHGAVAGEDLTHLSILLPGTMTIDD